MSSNRQDSAKVNRRKFVQKSLAGAAAATCILASTRSRGGPAFEKSPIRFGLVTYLWGRDWDLPTLIHNCEASGVLGVELRTTHAHGVEPELTASQRRAVKKRLGDSPITLLGPGSDERFDNPDPALLRKAIERTRSFIQLSHDIGGTGVKVKPDRFHEGVPRKQTIRQIGESLNSLGRFAADYGQEVRLEVHGQCSPLPIVRRIMDIAQHPSVVLCWNSNPTDLEGQGLEHNFRLVRDRLGMTTHVRELDLDNYPYQRLIELLLETNYQGWALLEAHDVRENRVQAMIEQRRIFEEMVKEAQFTFNFQPVNPRVFADLYNS